MKKSGIIALTAVATVAALAGAALYLYAKELDTQDPDVDLEEDDILPSDPVDEPAVEPEPIVEPEPAVEPEPSVEPEPAVEEEPIVEPDATDQPSGVTVTWQ